MTNDLNLPTIPPDIYQRIDNALELQEMHSEVKLNEPIRIANGLNYYRAFSPWFSDWRASESQLLHFFDSLIEPFPGLRALKLAYKKQMRIGPIISAWDIQESYMYSTVFQKKLESLRAWVPPDEFGYGDHFDLMIGANELSVFAPRDYDSLGTSQWYRDQQTGLAGYAFTMLSEALFHLRRLCESYNFDMNIRPMYTMQSAMTKDIRAAMMKGGISSEYAYLSSGQRAVWDRLKANHIALPYDDHMLTSTYWDWYYRASYMYLKDNDDNYSGLEIHFGPWNIPPTLISRPTESAPYYSGESRPTFHIRHAIHYIQQYHPSMITIEVIHQANKDGNPIAIMADLMPVICGCLTLISLSTQTGQGQYKPTWTAAPFSKGMLKLFPFACAQAIQAARNLK